MRCFLALFLLANYLLMVGAGLCVGRPAEPAFSAAHPYQHSKACQQENYLRLDCFEHCNGEQQARQRHLPEGTGLHFLAQLKGLDVHGPLGLGVAMPAPPVGGATAAAVPAAAAPALVPGFGGRCYPPPRWG